MILNENARNLMSYAIRLLRADPNDQLARRLAAITRNSGIPLHLLSRIIPNLDINIYERVSLPLNMHGRFARSLSGSPLIQAAIRSFNKFVTGEISKADLRYLFWNRLLTDLLIYDRSDGHVKFLIKSELNILRVSNIGSRIDLAVLDSDSDFPTLIVEIGKDRPNALQDPKGFTKLCSMVSQSCLRKVCCETKR